nr:MAG TPA: hypothetical protein [Caudoviricetes sp.]DAW74860.1 MAG TPA: hypothetical protein [Ackermannviridae sp.]
MKHYKLFLLFYFDINKYASFLEKNTIKLS